MARDHLDYYDMLDEELLRDVERSCWMPSYILPLTWLSDSGQPQRTFAMYVSSLTEKEIHTTLLDLVKHDVAILRADDRCCTVVKHNGLTIRILLHSWATNILVEFELMHGLDSNFQLAVACLGPFLKEADNAACKIIVGTVIARMCF